MIDSDTVAVYRERMEEGDAFPPVVVYFDGTDHWLADGFHRVDAARLADWKNIEADVHQGTQRDAILHSVGANSKHGKPRSNSDKRRAVTTVLTNELVCKNEAGKPWSDRSISRICKVDGKTVAAIRDSLSADFRRCDDERVASRNGKEYTINTANIGRKPDPAPKSLDEQCADENAYLDSVGMGASDDEPAAPKRINIKREDEAEDELNGGVMTAVERQVRHTNEPTEITEEKGVGVIRANEAINALMRIPRKDALRARGFQMVQDWIRANKDAK